MEVEELSDSANMGIVKYLIFFFCAFVNLWFLVPCSEGINKHRTELSFKWIFVAWHVGGREKF